MPLECRYVAYRYKFMKCQSSYLADVLESTKVVTAKLSYQTKNYNVLTTTSSANRRMAFFTGLLDATDCASFETKELLDRIDLTTVSSPVRLLAEILVRRDPTIGWTSLLIMFRCVFEISSCGFF
jgi:hypothetical protein